MPTLRPVGSHAASRNASSVSAVTCRGVGNASSRLTKASLREVPRLEKRTAYLAMLSNVAMLAGLLGTIVGLIKCFGAVASADPSEKATMLAAGISEAMNCTAFGLLTAIPGLLFFSLLNGKTQHLNDDINEASVAVLNLVVTNRDKLDLSTLGAARED